MVTSVPNVKKNLNLGESKPAGDCNRNAIFTVHPSPRAAQSWLNQEKHNLINYPINVSCFKNLWHFSSCDSVGPIETLGRVGQIGSG